MIDDVPKTISFELFSKKLIESQGSEFGILEIRIIFRIHPEPIFKISEK